MPRGDDDDRWVAGNREIQRIADAIEARRLEMGKDSGFERMYGRVTLFKPFSPGVTAPV